MGSVSNHFRKGMGGIMSVRESILLHNRMTRNDFVEQDEA